MENKISKTKKLIIIAISMVAVAAVLIFVIISLNKKSDLDTGENDVTSTENNNLGGNAGTDKVVMADNNTEGGEQTSDKAPITEDNTSEDTMSGDKSTDEEPTPTAIVEADPITVTLGEYQGIKTEYSPVVISDSDIDKQLDSLRSEHTDIINMPTRPFEKGDMAIVTYEGKVDGKLIQELYGVCFQDILGRGMLPDTFEDEIIGRKIGDTFTISMDYPEDFTDIPEVAGKTVVFDVSLVDGFIFYTPEIDDAFIKENTEYSTVDEYKTETKAALQKEQDDIAYEAAVKELKKKIIENSAFTGPIDTEIKKQYVRSINELNNQYQEEYGIDAATYYQIFYGISPEEYTASVMEDAEIEVKYSYILQTIANEKGITVEEADKTILESAVIEGMER